jgi:predicted dehydrogenase
MPIQPFIIGSGRSGQAIAKSFQCLSLIHPELEIESPIWVERGTRLKDLKFKREQAVLCVANPHGLHAERILEADREGFRAILCEKPACVNLEQIRALRTVKTPTAILHIYRQMWGPQTLKRMVMEGELGEVLSIEGRYWQASTAERSLASEQTEKGQSWKNDPGLSGKFDTYLDVGTHWVDTAGFLLGAVPVRITGWRSYLNADAPHRDSHIQLALDYQNGGRAFGSISKSVHGATNHFEMNVIGSKLFATWEFMKPDEITIGEGRDRRVVTRKDSELGSKQSPHHGMGWLEGYLEISSRLLRSAFAGEKCDYPGLQDNLDLLDKMLAVTWQE